MSNSNINIKYEDGVLQINAWRSTDVTLPESVFADHPDTEVIYISMPNLRYFPESLFTLKKLRTLNLDNHSLVDYGGMLGKLQPIETLRIRVKKENEDIHDNLQFFEQQAQIRSLTLLADNFKSFPKEFTNLKNLEHLDITSPQWRFKKDIPHLKQFPQFKKLRIGLFYGKKWITEIEQLTQLEEIDLWASLEKKVNHLEMVESLGRMKNLKRVNMEFSLNGKEVGDSIVALHFLEKLKVRGWATTLDHPSALSGALVKNVEWGNYYNSVYSNGDDSEEIFNSLPDIDQFTNEDRKLVFAFFLGAEALLKKLIPNVLLKTFENKTPTNIQLKTKIKGKSAKKIREELEGTSFTINGKETKQYIYIFDSSVPFEDLYEWFQEGKTLLPKDHLTELLTVVTSPWLMQEENEESNENVYRLFESNQTKNYLVAMQILEGGGANEILLSMVAAISACHPDKKVARAAEKVYDKYGASTFKARLKKVSLRRSGSSYRKLDTLLNTTEVNDMAFRIMHHHIASTNPTIKDVSGDFLEIRKVNCLNPIPKEIRFFPNITGLDASLSKNLNLEKSIEALAGMGNLKELDLSSCHYQIPNAITQLKNLTSLVLKQNEISNPEILAEFSMLQFLSVEGCGIQSWSWLKRLVSLRTLNIANNKITEIPDEVFSLQSISSLDLHQNKLKKIDERLLDLNGLSYLNLSGNKITEILYPLFALPSMTYLLLRSNQITAFDDEKIKQLLTHQSSGLYELSLTNNKITSFKFQFPNFSQLRVLDISKNQITHLDNSIFDGTKIQEFYAQNNQIESIPETMRDRFFTKVNLAYNEIKEFPESFSTVTIQNLDIRHNYISSIPSSFKRRHDHDFSRLYWKMAGNPVADRKHGFDNMVD